MQPNDPFKRQQDQFRKQQEQFRKQQEDWRRQQMAAQWMAQQKSGEAPVQPSASVEQVRQAVHTLRNELKAGRISQEEAEKQMSQHILQDANGDFWTMGFESGAWYRWLNNQWVKTAQGPASAKTTDLKKPKSRGCAGFIAFLFSAVIFFGLGFVAGNAGEQAAESMNLYEASGVIAIIAAGIVWLIGLVISIRVWRRVARG